MSGACLLIGGTALTLASSGFDLNWTHSVEKTVWREHWMVTEDGLHLTEAAVKGSGAGMDPGEGAQLVDGWWVWVPDVPPIDNLVLAASGATDDGWRICDGLTCHDIGSKPGSAVILTPCER